MSGMLWWLIAGAGTLAALAPGAQAAPAGGGGGSPPEPDEGGGFYRSRFANLFEKYGPPVGVDPLWLAAFCLNESSDGQDPSVLAGAVSSDGLSKGIMQLTETTANDYEDVSLDDLNNPETSVRIAAKFIQTIRRSFDPADPRYTEWCVKSYNQGVGATQKERAGTRTGAAAEYWARWQRNFAKVGGTKTWA